MGCSEGMGIGQGVVRHMTQWALLVWSVTQVWVPGHTTLEHDSRQDMKIISNTECDNPENLTYHPNSWILLTFALSLVHDLQVWVSHAASHQQSALILICLPIAATHSMFPGNVRTVWRAHTLRPAHLHLTNFPGTAFDSFTGVYKNTVSGFICAWALHSVSVMLLY